MSADGHFGLNIRRHKKFTLGTNCKPIITIRQERVSLITLEYIVTFRCGKSYQGFS